MFLFLTLIYLFLGSIRAAPEASLIPPDIPIPTLTFADGALTCDCRTNERTLTEIVWSCLATVFACSWVAVHPNIPRSDAPWWYPALMRLELMMWTILAPELMIYWAMRQWIGARSMQNKMDRSFPTSSWTLTHGYFLQMGGFILFDGEVSKGALDFYRIYDLLMDGKIKMPRITEEELQDRSKGDALSKTVVLGQTAWFVTQCISRRVQHLVVTEIELVTLAFAVLSGFMYFFWWNKPLDARTSVPVYLLELPPIAEDLEGKILETRSTDVDGPLGADIISTGRADRHGLRRIFYDLLIRWPVHVVKTIYRRLTDMSVFNDSQESEHIKEGAQHVHTFYAHILDFKDVNAAQVKVSIIGAIFGAIHCLGWNFTFPSNAESVLWRGCSLLITVVPTLMVIRYFLYKLPHESFGSRVLLNKVLWPLIVYIALPSYFLARIILIVEAFINLRDLSPSALAQVHWSSLLPHI